MAQFALKSGDYNALSKPDIRLIALTHMLQQHNQKAIFEAANPSAKAPASATTEETTAETNGSAGGVKSLPSPAEFKKSNWSRALFADKLATGNSSTPHTATNSTSSTAAAAATEEDYEQCLVEAEEIPLFNADDFPALGSAYMSDIDEEDEHDEDEHQEDEEENREEEMGMDEEAEDVIIDNTNKNNDYSYESEDDYINNNSDNNAEDMDIDEETLRLREVEEAEASASVSHTHHTHHTHNDEDEDCPCREVSPAEMAEFDKHATQVLRISQKQSTQTNATALSTNTIVVEASVAAGGGEAEEGTSGKKKKMRHKKLRKLLLEQQSADNNTNSNLNSSSHSTAVPSSSSSSSALLVPIPKTKAPKRVPQSKDEREDDGVGWISSTNIDKAQRITKWKLPKSAFATASNTRNASAAGSVAPVNEQPAVWSEDEEEDEAINAKTANITEQEVVADQIMTEDSHTEAVSASATTTTTAFKNNSKVDISWDGVQIVCCTSDFSMQNVLVQLGLRVISPTGQCIKAVRRYVMYCNACYRIHRKESDLTRLFCAYCGANHLSRVACTMLENGEVQLHLKRNYTLSQKGTKYPLPAPGNQPRFQGELLMREDQLMTGIWKQRALRVKKEVASAFGEEVASDLGVHVNKGAKIVVGLGGKKNNPNAMKGRERRGKRRTNNQIK